MQSEREYMKRRRNYEDEPIDVRIVPGKRATPIPQGRLAVDQWVLIFVIVLGVIGLIKY